MRDPQAALCALPTCLHRVNLEPVLCCSRDGGCASDALHTDCRDLTDGMRSPTPGNCSTCSGAGVLVCSKCRRCGGCDFHTFCSN